MSELEKFFKLSPNDLRSANVIEEFANTLICDSTACSASHIHIQRSAKGADVWYRVAGALLSIGTLTTEVADKLLLRFKLLADIDVKELRRVQDGRIRVVPNGDLWCSFMPSFKGWTLVLTWQSQHRKKNGQLSELGMVASQQAKSLNLLSSDHGILVLSGYRGSYGVPAVGRSLLMEASRNGRIAVALEYGSRRPIAGVNQCDIRSIPSLTGNDWFNVAIRQQADVIFVEVPDYDFFDKLVLRAAEDCLIIVEMTRPIEMSACTINPAKRQAIAEMMLGSINQRLHRRICEQCHFLYQPRLYELNALGLKCSDRSRLTFAKNVGCPACRNNWWWNDQMIGTHEVVSMTGEIQELYSQDAPQDELRKSILRSGIITHFQSAVSKVMQQDIAAATIVSNFRERIASNQWLDIDKLSLLLTKD